MADGLGRADRLIGLWKPAASAATEPSPRQVWTDADGPFDPVRFGDSDAAFALAVADADGLLLARDPIGHRSLYWARRPDGAVRFSSSIHGVLADPLVPRHLDRLAVADYLAYSYVPGERTLVQAVRAVPAGAVVRFDATGHHTRRFWQLPAVPQAFDPEPQLRDQLRLALAAAVARALPDGPVCATLSGGIDSSLVLALACRSRQAPVPCLSVSFGADHANELPFSSLVAAHLGACQHVVEVSTADIAAHFDQAVCALSEPNGDPLTVPNWLLFQRARELGGVVLNGEGGDPCFGGPKNAPMLLAALLGEDDDERGRQRDYLRAHQRLFDDFGDALHDDMRHAVADDRLPRELTPWFADPRYPGLIDQLMAINVVYKGAWHILPKVDHLGFVHGCRPRSPLFDRRVVELSMRIPSHLKRAGAVEKHLLKEAVRDLLPTAIIDRPKSGMLVPVEAWFAGPLRDFARPRLLDSLTSMRIVRRDWLERLSAYKLGGLRPRRGIKVWQLLTLEAWIRGMGVWP